MRMNPKKWCLPVIIAIAILACSTDRKNISATAQPTDSISADTSRTGEWTRKGLHGETGLRLAADGSAATINMPGLNYEAWHRQGDTLFVSGRAGHGEDAVDVTDTYLADGDTLTLQLGGQPALKYVRRQRP